MGKFCIYRKLFIYFVIKLYMQYT